METCLFGLAADVGLLGLAVRIAFAAGLILVLVLVTGFVLAMIFRTVECVRDEPRLFGHESLGQRRHVGSATWTEGEVLQPCIE